MAEYIRLPDNTLFEIQPGETAQQAAMVAMQKYPEAFRPQAEPSCGEQKMTALVTVDQIERMAAAVVDHSAVTISARGPRATCVVVANLSVSLALRRHSVLALNAVCAVVVRVFEAAALAWITDRGLTWVISGRALQGTAGHAGAVGACLRPVAEVIVLA